MQHDIKGDHQLDMSGSLQRSRCRQKFASIDVNDDDDGGGDNDEDGCLPGQRAVVRYWWHRDRQLSAQ